MLRLKMHGRGVDIPARAYFLIRPVCARNECFHFKVTALVCVDLILLVFPRSRSSTDNSNDFSG
jgi:hypothetical protein